MRQISIGIQLTADFFDLPAQTADDLEQVRTLIHVVAKETGVRIRQEHYERFAPVGITGIAIVSESHIAVHTWPEYNYLALDYFSCRRELPPSLLPRLKRLLGTERCRARVNRRFACKGDWRRRDG